jgi:protein-S-isoprenylcysteine O-methyltransferase Ste14
MSFVLSAVSVLGFLAIFVLSLGGTRFGWGRYWPPEAPGTWQHFSFRVLFRVGLYPLIALSAILAREDGFWMPVLGVILIGFGGAFAFTRKLGWKQAFGAATGLITSGPYAYSRNPVYVATWVGLLGWAICLLHPLVVVPLVLWAVMYVFAPFLEEPWLVEQFGAEYAKYKETVPRFVGF